MHYYQFCIGDYAKDCRHLSWDEDLAYRRLLDVYYAREEPLPIDIRTVFRLVCAQTESQRTAVETILSEFFEKTEQGWRNFRCDTEIHAFKQKSLKATQSAKSRWDKAKAQQSDSDRNADVSVDKCERIDYNCERNANHKPITNNQEPINKNIATKVAAPDGVSVELWSDFLTLRRSKKLPVTKTALDGLAREATKAGMSIAQVIRTCCERGWGGFKAEWLKDSKQQLTGQQSAWLTITGQTLNNEDDYHGRTIEADFLPPALLGK